MGAMPAGLPAPNAPVAPVTAPATGLSRLALVARDIKISHSIFALPFALLATFLAHAHKLSTLPAAAVVANAANVAGGATTASRVPGAALIALIVACMVLARTLAMAFNRWADAKIDALNPRTQGRAIPSGRLSGTVMLSVAIICAFGFVAASAGFWLLDGNLWPLLLSPVLIVYLAGYSYMKRFTWLCHLYLGTALALSPIAASIAVAPAFLSQPGPWLLAGMVTCWVAGFDIIYALQDVEPDRATGIHSMPAKLGVEPALWISRLLHVGALALLVVMALATPQLGVGFRVGVGVVAGLLVLEHALVWGSKTHHIHMAFFTLNGVISVLLGGLGIWDVLG